MIPLFACAGVASVCVCARGMISTNWGCDGTLINIWKKTKKYLWTNPVSLVSLARSFILTFISDKNFNLIKKYAISFGTHQHNFLGPFITLFTCAGVASVCVCANGMISTNWGHYGTLINIWKKIERTRQILYHFWGNSPRNVSPRRKKYLDLIIKKVILPENARGILPNYVLSVLCSVGGGEYGCLGPD